jgi:asparagine synthase (glutamine-hydrolysing)
LSGDGGDELFGGYNRYFEAARLWGQLKRLPAPVRLGAGALLGRLPPRFWNAASPLLPGGRRQPQFGSKVQRALRTMARATDLDDVYAAFVNEWKEESELIPGSAALRHRTPLDFRAGDPAVPDAVRMMTCDALTYLPGDILTKVDRAAMAVSLETRVPFLDHRVAAVAARIPIGMKIAGGQGKLILRKLLYRHAPRQLFERPKAGFGIPVGDWLRGPLRPWAEALLDERALREGGFFAPAPVRRRWAAHLAGREEAQALWPVLMFCAWREAARTEPRPAPRVSISG